MKLFVMFLLLFSSFSYGCDFDSKKMIFNTLAPVIAESLSDGKRVVSYCPDNLCLLTEANDLQTPECCTISRCCFICTKQIFQNLMRKTTAYLLELIPTQYLLTWLPSY